MITEAGAAISSLKAAIDIAKGIASLQSQTEVNQAIIDIQHALLDAQSAALADKEALSNQRLEISQLENEIAANAQWNKFLARYVLTRSERGCFTYNLKPEFDNEEVFHRLCTTCIDQKAKSILQTVSSRNGGEVVECHRCKSRLHLTEFRDPPVMNDRGDDYY